MATRSTRKLPPNLALIMVMPKQTAEAIKRRVAMRDALHDRRAKVIRPRRKTA